MNDYADIMLAAAETFCSACLAVADDKAPLEAGGWNVHQLAAHTHDVEIFVYGERMHRTVAEENPEFQDFDAETWMAAHYDPDEPLKDLLDRFMTSVQEAADWLEALPASAWARKSRHESVSGKTFTLENWVERNIAHIEEHLETIEMSR